MKNINKSKLLVIVSLTLELCICFILLFINLRIPLNFQDELRKINEASSSIKTSNVAIENYTTNLSKEELLTEEEYDTLFSPSYYMKVDTLSSDAAASDVHLYFKALRCLYGAYSFYGGDEVFSNAEENIISMLSSLSSITTNDLQTLIKNNLTFIDDKNLSFGTPSINVNNSTMYYENSLIQIHKNIFDNYVISINDKNYEINSINSDEDIEKYLKLTIDDSGKLIYTIGILAVYDGEESMSIPITISRNGKAEEKYIDLFISSYSINDNLTSTNDITNHNNIPILTIKTLPYSITDEGNKLLKTAEEIKAAPISIIDLRGNNDGDILTAMKWQEKYFGQVSMGKAQFLLLYGRYNHNISLYEYTNLQDDLETMNLSKINDYYYLNKLQDNIKIKDNSNIIFILVDKGTSAAAEYFIEGMRDYNNVILVGSNTYGNLQCSSVYYGFLPNSMIDFSFGNWLRLYDSSFFKEGEGLKPDIWVDAASSLELTQKLIKHYNLNNFK